MTGNFILVEGDNEAQSWLYQGDLKVDYMLRDLVSDLAEHAGTELEVLAPGRIGTELVRVDTDRLEDVGRNEATAGVIPDFNYYLGVDPSDLSPTISAREDFPFYVDEGTGIYGEYGRPITPTHHDFMSFYYQGNLVFAREVRGQEAQHYSDRAFDNSIAWFPGKLAAEHLPE